MSFEELAMREWAWNVGMDRPDVAWLLHPFDVWMKNHHYTGPEQPHPEDAEY